MPSFCSQLYCKRRICQEYVKIHFFEKKQPPVPAAKSGLMARIPRFLNRRKKPLHRPFRRAAAKKREDFPNPIGKSPFLDSGAGSLP